MYSLYVTIVFQNWMHIDECCWTARNGIPFNCSRSDLNDRVDSGEWRAYQNIIAIYFVNGLLKT